MVGKKRKIPVCPMPCREEQFEEISVFIRDNVAHETSRCMYVSGVPGTGKTLIVQSAINELKVHDPDLSFKHIYVNGLTLGSNPGKLWRRLWKEIEGEKVAPKQALRKLMEYFETREIEPTVLVVDELDQLMDKKQSILYRLLEWTTNPIAKFSLIAIFNTMSLPESALVNRNASRIGFARVIFPPYDHSQLQTIVESSLISGKKRKELSKDALILLSRKVAAISGDARRALEIAKRTLEILETSSKPGTLAVDEAFKELFSSPKIDTIRDCSELEKAILESIISELTRNGTEETTFGPVLTNVEATSSYDGKYWSTDNVIAALVRLVTLKLVIMDTNGKYISRQSRLSVNVPTEDVKFALAQHHKNK